MLHCMQKINFIKKTLVILCNLGMPGHTQNNSINLKKPLMFIYGQKYQFYPSRFYLDITNLLFWVLWEW